MLIDWDSNLNDKEDGSEMYRVLTPIFFLCRFLDDSADYMQALQMKFTSKEDAIAFADKQGM